MKAKAREGVKSREVQPRRTLRRRGRGMVRPPSGEPERAVSGPAVRPVGCQLAGGLGEWDKPWGGYAACAVLSDPEGAANAGYQRWKSAPSSSFRTRVRICKRRWAPRGVH